MRVTGLVLGCVVALVAGGVLASVAMAGNPPPPPPPTTSTQAPPPTTTTAPPPVTTTTPATATAPPATTTTTTKSHTKHKPKPKPKTTTTTKTTTQTPPVIVTGPAIPPARTRVPTGASSTYGVPRIALVASAVAGSLVLLAAIALAVSIAFDRSRSERRPGGNITIR